MPSRLTKHLLWSFGVIAAAFALRPLAVSAQDAAAAAPAYATQADLDSLKVAANTIWVLITGALVFFMNLGFALVESGFNRQKNAVNILSKNFVVFALSSVSFWALGWGLMFGGDPNTANFVGNDGLWFVGGADNSPATGEAYAGVYSSISWTAVPLWAKFFFQLVFAGTAATIVSGAVCERIKFSSFCVFSLLLVAIIYPVVGHWLWGGGWAADGGAWDFAGSTVVHSVGGWAALAGVIALGPRLGRFNKDGSANAIPGHNLLAATTGAIVLWLGWFGFNPGSTMAADAGAISHIFVTTNTGGVFGLISATLLAWLLLKRPGLDMMINGLLAGLVAITAPCAFVTVADSAIIGIASGILVVVATLTIEKLKLDDPVGAIPVHLCNGVFGTICVGLFATDKITGAATGNGLFHGGGTTLLMAQLKAVAGTGVFVFGLSLVFWYAIKAILGLRVSAEEEHSGLDVGEHGQQCYPDFAISSAARPRG